jgi:addiction module HigA family antidote
MKTRILSHPGEILREEFLVPLGMSARQLAEALGVPANRISEICRERREVTADTAMRLSCYFGTTPHLWLNMQASHNLSVAQNSHDYSTIKPRAA